VVQLPSSATVCIAHLFKETGITNPEHEYDEYAATISEGSRVILKVQPAR